MSGDEEEYGDYDDEEYLYLEEGPVTEADDLAQHAINSPVYDLVLAFDEGYTDYEDYFTDDYYDYPTPSDVKKLPTAEKSKSMLGVKRKATNKISERKRRKREPAEDIPELSLGEFRDSASTKPPPSRIVTWKTEHTFVPCQVPVIADDEGDKIALLKDWRERFQQSLNTSANTSKTAKNNQHSSPSIPQVPVKVAHSQPTETGRAVNGVESQTKLTIHPEKEEALVPAPKKRARLSMMGPIRQHEEAESATLNRHKPSTLDPSHWSSGMTPSTNPSTDSRKRKAETLSEADDELDGIPSKKATPNRRTERKLGSRTSSRAR